MKYQSKNEKTNIFKTPIDSLNLHPNQYISTYRWTNCKATYLHRRVSKFVFLFYYFPKNTSQLNTLNMKWDILLIEEKSQRSFTLASFPKKK